MKQLKSVMRAVGSGNAEKGKCLDQIRTQKSFAKAVIKWNVVNCNRMMVSRILLVTVQILNLYLCIYIGLRQLVQIRQSIYTQLKFLPISFTSLCTLLDFLYFEPFTFCLYNSSFIVVQVLHFLSRVFVKILTFSLGNLFAESPNALWSSLGMHQLKNRVLFLASII